MRTVQILLVSLYVSKVRDDVYYFSKQQRWDSASDFFMDFFRITSIKHWKFDFYKKYKSGYAALKLRNIKNVYKYYNQFIY